MGDGRGNGLVGSAKTKQIFDTVSLKDSYGPLFTLLESMEEDILRRLRTCTSEELLEVQAEARVIHKLKEKIQHHKQKQEKDTPKVLPSGV